MIKLVVQLTFPEGLNDNVNPVVKRTLSSFWHFGMDVVENGGIVVIERPTEKSQAHIEFRNADEFYSYWNDNCPRKPYKYER
tara:strand:+ start:235 stop:480 length:246 start_codon:yes stop_codon:yes gene_type:complete